MQNRLFVTHKPEGKVCNRYLNEIKRRYNTKKAGFSGTLDPFASGCLIVAFGQYTKLFRFLKKTPKRYKATLWIGAVSPTLDTEKIEEVIEMAPFHPDTIKLITENLVGKVTYVPPKYSAKKIDGKRAYELARKDEAFEMKTCEMEIYELKVLGYEHPYLSFEVSVSEGAYVRSIGELICEKLRFPGALSALERLNEGAFYFDEEKALDPLVYIDAAPNEYLGDPLNVRDGKVLSKDDFKIKDEGRYYFVVGQEFSIVDIEGDEVIYQLNRMELC